MSKPQKAGSRPCRQRKKEAKRLKRRRQSRKYRGDNFHRYRAVRDALRQFYPGEPKGNLARHLNTLAWLVSGIVGSRHTNYLKIARKSPDGNKPASREKRFSRWVNNERVDYFFVKLTDLGEFGYRGRRVLIVSRTSFSLTNDKLAIGSVLTFMLHYC